MLYTSPYRRGVYFTTSWSNAPASPSCVRATSCWSSSVRGWSMARFLFLTFGPGTDDNKSEIRRGAARTEFIFSTEDALAPAIAHGEKPEQIAERGDEGGDVGEGGGVEHTVYARDLSAGLHNPHLLQNICGAPRDRKSTRLNSSHTVISYAV